jgi:hypothetical protein
MTKDDKQIFQSFLNDPPVRAEPDPADRDRLRRVTSLKTARHCRYLAKVIRMSELTGISRSCS